MRAPALHRHGKPKQRGASLMIMISILVVAFAAMLVGALSLSALNSARQEKTAAALAQAKDALIGYAITYGDTHTGEVHGYLPCPDMDGNGSGNPEGSSELTCGTKNVSSIGRLPWKMLSLPELRDGDGECLWYAVSGTYKNNPKTDFMNWDNSGLFDLKDASGATIASGVVAVIFAPGAVTGNQNRVAGGNAPACGGNYTAANYLDSDGTINNATVSGTANAISQFRAGMTAQINDRFVFITKDDIFNSRNFTAKLNTMTDAVAKCIAYFGTKNKSGGAPNPANKSLPWPANLALADYTVNTNYNDINYLFAGRVPYRVNTARSTTSNMISSDYLLQSDGANCPSGWAAIYPWWDNWKDHLFYALGDRYEPGTANTASCWAGHCLSINGSGNYAAVVMFAGKKLSGQSRADKSVLTNYLEDINATHFPGANGDEDYKSAASSSTFNDILYCIDQNLNVNPC